VQVDVGRPPSGAIHKHILLAMPTGTVWVWCVLFVEWFSVFIRVL